jgi:hypothetical protein
MSLKSLIQILSDVHKSSRSENAKLESGVPGVADTRAGKLKHQMEPSVRRLIDSKDSEVEPPMGIARSVSGRSVATHRTGDWENAMGLEAVYFLGALVLLTALIYGTLSYHYRNRAATRVGDEIVRERYRQNQG